MQHFAIYFGGIAAVNYQGQVYNLVNNSRLVNSLLGTLWLIWGGKHVVPAAICYIYVLIFFVV